MADSVTEVSRQGWGSRLSGSFKGIIVGLVLVGIALWLLFWNEGRAVRRYKALKEGKSAVVSVASDRVDAANEGKLIHVTGLAEPQNVLMDRELGISADALHLERTVEMYQWIEDKDSETEKKTGGSTETRTTYSYSRGWSEQLQDSSSFKEPSGHENPTSMPYRSETYTAEDVRLGAFRLSDSLINKIRNWEDMRVSSTGLLPSTLRSQATVSDGAFYVGANPASPQVGDLRISYRLVEPTVVSLASGQTGDSFSPYVTRNGTVELLRTGTVAAEELFTAAEAANKTLTWILRFVGFFLMFFGIRLMVRPLSVLADVLPALGNLAEKGLGLFAFVTAALISLVVIAVAWLFYRPLLAIGLLLLALAALLAVMRMMKKAKARPAPAGTVPPPPPPAPA